MNIQLLTLLNLFLVCVKAQTSEYQLSGTVYALASNHVSLLLGCQVANRAPGMPGAPTIECEANGDYKPRQCNYSARTCYCVTINGENIPNTWWSLVASDNASPKDCVAERLRYAGGNNNFITTTSSPGNKLALLSTSNELNATLLLLPGKAGSCPTATGFGTCISNCQRDTDCFGSLKCCSNGCGQTCQSPVNSVFPLTTPTPFGKPLKSTLLPGA